MPLVGFGGGAIGYYNYQTWVQSPQSKKTHEWIRFTGLAIMVVNTLLFVCCIALCAVTAVDFTYWWVEYKVENDTVFTYTFAPVGVLSISCILICMLMVAGCCGVCGFSCLSFSMIDWFSWMSIVNVTVEIIALVVYVFMGKKIINALAVLAVTAIIRKMEIDDYRESENSLFGEMSEEEEIVFYGSSQKHYDRNLVSSDLSLPLTKFPTRDEIIVVSVMIALEIVMIVLVFWFRVLRFRSYQFWGTRPVPKTANVNVNKNVNTNTNSNTIVVNNNNNNNNMMAGMGMPMMPMQPHAMSYPQMMPHPGMNNGMMTPVAPPSNPALHPQAVPQSSLALHPQAAPQSTPALHPQAAPQSSPALHPQAAPLSSPAPQPPSTSSNVACKVPAFDPPPAYSAC